MRHDELPRTDNVPRLPSLVGRAVRPVGVRLLRGWYDVHVHGTSRVPRSGPVLLASNHMGILDGPMLIGVCPRYVHALVKREMFDGMAGPTFRAFGQISLERKRIDVRAVKQAIRVLRDGQVAAIYPEGTRGNGDFGHVRLGVAYLALVTGAPVVPVGTLGTRLAGQHVGAVPPRGSRVDVVFGDPIRPATDPVPWPRRRSDVAALAEHLRTELAAHIRRAVEATGQSLPGEAPDAEVDAEERRGPEVGPEAEEQAS